MKHLVWQREIVGTRPDAELHEVAVRLSPHPGDSLTRNRKEVRSLIENPSTPQLQSLFPECFYLKGLPEESSHLARRSNGTLIAGAGLDRHGNGAGLAFEVVGWEWVAGRESVHVSVHMLTHTTLKFEMPVYGKDGCLNGSTPSLIKHD